VERYSTDHYANQPSVEYCQYTGPDLEHVSLDKWELAGAIQVGKWRRDESVRLGDHDYRLTSQKPTTNAQGHNIPERLNLVGAIAERAAAKALGLYWHGHVNVGKVEDLAHNIEVRLIGVASYGLRVYSNDPQARRVVGVIIPQGAEKLGSYAIPGWIEAEYGRERQFKMNPYNGRPMYAVPQECLRPLSELRAIIAQERLNANHMENV
jgi:hypothetical protein